MKDAELDMGHAKYQAARRWVSAVNNWARLGKWDFPVCKDPLALARMVAGIQESTGQEPREQLDFISNYDIKYRMGGADGGAEDEEG